MKRKIKEFRLYKYIIHITFFCILLFFPSNGIGQLEEGIGVKNNTENCFAKYFNYENYCDTDEVACGIYYAIKNLNYKGIECLVNKTGNLNVKTDKVIATQVPIIQASLISDKKMMKILLNGKDVNLEIKDKEYGSTALMWVNFLVEIPEAKGNYLDTTKLLIKYGADVNTQNKEGYTPLMMNSISNRLNFVELFLEKNADSNIQTKNGETALMLAWDNPQIIIALLNASADKELKDKKGRTAIFYAIENCQPNKLSLLINNEANLDVQDKDGLNPRSFAKKVLTYGKCATVFDLLGIKFNKSS